MPDLDKDATSISSATVGLDRDKLLTHIPKPDLSNSYACSKSLKYTGNRKGETTIYVLRKNKNNTSFSSENLHFYSREKS